MTRIAFIKEYVEARGGTDELSEDEKQALVLLGEAAKIKAEKTSKDSFDWTYSTHQGEVVKKGNKWEASNTVTGWTGSAATRNAAIQQAARIYKKK